MARTWRTMRCSHLITVIDKSHAMCHWPGASSSMAGDVPHGIRMYPTVGGCREKNATEVWGTSRSLDDSPSFGRLVCQ
ncbi:uncharacterized protein BP01DRAFT_358249 [Aspergillus saccharolyticus JOP 1030-1]|uniref:Uncharacterized protein n=1 Tax=Aspergillus saccharolyticus JOP 1030-1 TaxID=1450539 RepID=A0A318ZBE7_9EURO|nr:hypothetical protein BP01DRAFT_358249 [Aspergillus saccharolyticus JOP 1030-1]PYH43817.1 hypothetical protein BP01DRAFT_358249 [Aspergillus saccharolyticus JOP 1030-1]